MNSIDAAMTAVETGAADVNNIFAESLHDCKFWPHVGRVDNAFGDRNPVCSCVGWRIILNTETRSWIVKYAELRQNKTGSRIIFDCRLNTTYDASAVAFLT